MDESNMLIENIDKLHTTKLGIERIKKNLKLDTNDVISYCKNIILNRKSSINRKGKNWYCKLNNVNITINSYSYTVITAHLIK